MGFFDRLKRPYDPEAHAKLLKQRAELEDIPRPEAGTAAETGDPVHDKIIEQDNKMLDKAREEAEKADGERDNRLMHEDLQNAADERGFPEGKEE